MHWSPFLEIFIGLFLAAGAALGWFTRIPVILIGLGAGILVFIGMLLTENTLAFSEWNISPEALWVYLILALFAAVPAFITALLGRILKRRRQK